MQTYGYLLSQRLLPLPVVQYLFHILLRVGGHCDIPLPAWESNFKACALVILTQIIEIDPWSMLVTVQTQFIYGCPAKLQTDRRLFNGLFFRNNLDKAGTRKVKPDWILMEQEMTAWQWHPLDHLLIICSSLQTDNNHASTSSLNILQAGCSCYVQPAVSKH